MDDNDKSYESDSGTWDFVGEDTQIFDTQFSASPTSLFGNKYDGDTDQLHAIQSTIPFDDTVMCEYELATQVVDPDGETQGVNLDGETQVVDLDGETQVANLDTEFEEMDIFDETQVVDDSDTGEVVVSDHEGSEKTEIVDDSDEDSCRGEQTQNTRRRKVDMKEHEPKTDCGRSEQNTSGVGLKKFTSIRAASLRAAGLAALNKASKLSKSPPCPRLNSEPDTAHRRILFGKSHSRDLEKVNKSSDVLETGNKRRFGRATARKLFAEDPLAETNDANDSFDFGGAANSPVLETELVGLSYVDSQEPGDASQANALDFVDNFLKVNIGGDDNFGIRKSTGGKSKAVVSAKGSRTVAKSVNLIDGVNKRQVYDWDDNLEDEGGGDFFTRKKELFFASGSRRLKASLTSRSDRKVGRSDSKLVLGKNKEDKLKKILKTVVKEPTVKKNLINELDKEATDMPGGKNIQETTEARFDTQMAAGLQETGQDSTKTNDGRRTATRSQSKMSGDQSKKVTRAKSTAKKSKNFDNVASDVAERTGKMSLKRREVDMVEAPVAPDPTSVKKQCIQHVTTVARRTRQSMRCSESEKCITVPKDTRRCQKLSSTRKEIVTQSVSRLTRSKAATLTEQEKGLTTERIEQNISVTRKEIGTQSVPRLTRSKTATLTEQEKELTTERIEKNISVCTTPVSHRTPVKEPSPICMGDEYLKQSCRRSSLIQEVSSLFPSGSSVLSPNKDTRQGRDVSLIRVMFSRHLGGKIIKSQKKILSRLGALESSSVSDATHFIADDFVRTRNMLEAIASGKPVVTHHWLESCGQACCHIDEKSFILRDAKKEKEFGFNLQASLALARQAPLLKGRRVLITPNTKPGKEILSSLIKEVHGVAVERLGRSLLNIDKVPEELLILSCEEDYAVCLPFLEKGTAIYSSELLLNGIVIQRLEYERHRLFLDHVKKTRSTIWVKKDDKYKAVGKVK